MMAWVFLIIVFVAIIIYYIFEKYFKYKEKTREEQNSKYVRSSNK